MQGIFVTGSDTDVGKTYVSSQLIRLLIEKGLNVVPRKPVESGCKRVDDQLFPADAALLQQASRTSQTLEQICPCRFEPAISPQLAARQAGQPLSLSQLTSACLDHFCEDDFLLVEGAGGLLSPICENGLNAELAQALQLPLCIVVEDRVGAINQALLTLNAARSYALEVACIILNQVSDRPQSSQMDNRQELLEQTDIPIIQLAFNKTLSQDAIFQIFAR